MKDNICRSANRSVYTAEFERTLLKCTLMIGQSLFAIFSIPLTWQSLFFTTCFQGGKRYFNTMRIVDGIMQSSARLCYAEFTVFAKEPCYTINNTVFFVMFNNGNVLAVCRFLTSF